MVEDIHKTEKSWSIALALSLIHIYLPEWSKHKDSDECVMISDVIEEIYDELTRIREAIDVRDLGESCVKVSGDKTVAKILYAIEDKICNG